MEVKKSRCRKTNCRYNGGKKINLVLCKDISRLGRDYIGAGKYTDVIFPSPGCRFIALNDGVDTIRKNNEMLVILNEAYLGNTISLRQTTVSYKNKQRFDRPKDEWVVKENTHEASVSKGLRDIAHDVRRSKKRPRKNRKIPSLFSGLLFYADCGKPLLLRRSRDMDESKYSLTCATTGCTGRSGAQSIISENCS